jgi:hypothetical protein
MNASACVLIMSRSKIAEKIYVILCLPTPVSLKRHNIGEKCPLELEFQFIRLESFAPFIGVIHCDLSDEL